MAGQGRRRMLDAIRETVDGLHRSGLMTDSKRTEFHLPKTASTAATRLTAKELGDHGESYACELLNSRGFDAQLLKVNARTYDLQVRKGDRRFFVSVKVSRDKQHVRLGSRKSVLGLEAGNFVFAFLPAPGSSVDSLAHSAHTLLILPAEIARDDALSVHDAYWMARGKDPNIFSVMVKAYGSHHRDMWPRWLTYANAWNLLA